MNLISKLKKDKQASEQPKTCIVSLRMSENVKDALDDVAEALGKSHGWVVARLILAANSDLKENS